MKRSEINAALENAIRFLQDRKFHLPPFAFWTPEQWAATGPEADEIRANQLGWDVTDFGGGEFPELGLVIFTLRNGNHNNPEDKKPYAEKILIIEADQAIPMHFHRMKMEDIINRVGGNLLVEVYNSTPDGKLADSQVTVSLDGVKRTVPAGAVLRLAPGESITIPPRLYHRFRGEQGAGTVLIGEVSSVNDDYTDNIFLDAAGRFAKIQEDEPPLRLLMTEYPEAK